MAYSAKKYRVLSYGALALSLAGATLAFWLHRNRIDPASIGVLRALVGATVIGIAMRALSYRDEVQQQLGQKAWFFGSFIGLAAMAPAVVSLQTHRAWLDAIVQFTFRHPALPHNYFSLGVVIPVMFQLVAMLAVRLWGKLSTSPQA